MIDDIGRTKIMFEKIVLRRSEAGPSLTAGELAEALLYYQNVHIIFDYSSLTTLISQIGMPVILLVLDRPNVSAVYCKETLGTRTINNGGFEIHDFVGFSVAGNKETGAYDSWKKILEFILTTKHGYNRHQARRYAERFRMKVPVRNLVSDYYIEQGVTRSAREDLHDDWLVHESVRLVLHDLIGQENTPHNFTFIPHVAGGKFNIETDLDFEYINAEAKRRSSYEGNIRRANLINNLLTAKADMILASYYGGEFYTSELTSKIIRLKYSELLRRMRLDKRELEEFDTLVVGEGPSLCDAINYKQKTFEEFLSVLDKSQKFKEWIASINPDERIVREYWGAVASEGWLNKIPAKSLRYIIGAAVSAVNPIIGSAYSLSDSFLVEKLIGGWRPSHFVDKQLRPFIDNNSM